MIEHDAMYMKMTHLSSNAAHGKMSGMEGIKEFGRIVREARERKGITPAEMAAVIHRGDSYVSRLETGGIKTPPPDVVGGAAKLLGLDESRLVRLIGCLSTVQAAPSVVPFPKGSPAARVTDLMKAMSDEEVGFLLTTAEFIETHSAHDRDNETDGPRPKQQIG